MKLIICFFVVCISLPSILSQSNGQFVGRWRVVPSSIKIHGQPVRSTRSFNPGEVEMEIRRAGGNKYKATLKVVNTMNFDIEETVAAWKTLGGASSTYIGFTDDGYQQLEYAMRDLVENPGYVQMLGYGNNIHGMTISKGNTQATFTRIR